MKSSFCLLFVEMNLSMPFKAFKREAYRERKIAKLLLKKKTVSVVNREHMISIKKDIVVIVPFCLLRYELAHH